jgi:hypothetical protein
MAGVTHQFISMEIRTEDYERLGKFYLGRGYDLETKKAEGDLLLYDSKDLCTHGVVLGMTGSGKTGLCIALLEEAAMDNIPAIIIDPKGDIANLMLTFPNLDAASFRPWINEDDARRKDVTPDALAESTATMWKNGLAEWGQTAERISSYREKIDINIFTPGSRAGIPVSLLSSLSAPPFEVMDDAELAGERIESTVSSLLGLIGVSSETIQSPEAVLLSTIFHQAWSAGQSLTLETLIRHIQKPAFDKLGVIDLEACIPEKSRHALALRFNNLLASPGFATWLEGESLDIANMLHKQDGKPRCSIFSISHLDDTQRMFFVSLLLNQLLGWMRTQSGTSSLRAIFYMDEIFGFLPPTANPPSKRPMMTLLKQARAAGLGCLLATQNPVDLDYKALSNIGTWFLGRLQTERDKARLLDGLEGAATSQSGGFNRAECDRLLSSLGNRVFLMNNVHEDEPVLFHVRWVMSYLAGPLTRTQIKTLMDDKRGMPAISAPPPAIETNPMAMPGLSENPTTPASPRPAVGAGVIELFVVPAGMAEDIIYQPHLLREATIHFSSAKANVDEARSVRMVNPVSPSGIDWERNIEVPAALKNTTPTPGAGFSELPGFAMNAANYKQVEKDFSEWLYRNERGEVWFCPALKAWSKLGETEADFRARLLHQAHEARDEALEKIRDAVSRKLRALEARLATAEGQLERNRASANSAKVQAGTSILGGILGALLGRKSGIGTIARSGTAVSRSTTAYTRGKSVEVSKAKVDSIHAEIAEIQSEHEAEVKEVSSSFDPQALELESESLKPTRTNVRVDRVALLWMPYTGSGHPAW